MDYFEAAALFVVFACVLAIMVATLYDVGRDVVQATKRESKQERRRAKLPNNVLDFSQEKNRTYRATK